MGQPRFTREHPDQRNCALYYVDVLDPRTNFTTVCLGYVGETAREPFIRFMEHLYEQPFGDTIVGKPRVDPRVFAGKDEVWAAERAAVERLRPLYNYEFNLGNRDRVPIPVARRQREERDRARGVEPPGWDRPARPERQSVAPRRELAWGWLWTKPTGYVALWLVLATGLWVTTGHGGWDGVAAGVGGASGVFVVAWVKRPKRRRRRGRR